jgi:hypothetical protein
VKTAVEFPLEGFATVSNVQEQLTVVDYNLIGTVNYKAKIKGGHYTAIIKNADEFYCYNDNLVSIIPFRYKKENKAKIAFQRMATILLYCQSPPPESPAQAPEAVLAPGAAGTSPADDEVAAEEAPATAPSQVALREVAPSQETAAASVAPSHESAATSTTAASTTAVSAPESVTVVAQSPEALVRGPVVQQPAPEAPPPPESPAQAPEAVLAPGAAGENATMNLDRNEDESVDLLDDNSDERSLFSSSAKNDNDIPSPPAHINFEQFVEREEGHYCAICCRTYIIRDKALGTIQLPIPNDESSRLCRHVFCYECLQQM